VLNLKPKNHKSSPVSICQKFSGGKPPTSIQRGEEEKVAGEDRGGRRGNILQIKFHDYGTAENYLKKMPNNKYIAIECLN
jgi:hypothetical protein